MNISVNVKVPNGITNIKRILETGLKSGIQKSTAYISNQAVSNAPRITGNLKRSIHAEVSGLGGILTGKIIQDSGISSYGSFVEFGTGIYGPKGQPIKPVNKKVLAWKQNGKTIFARSVKGMKPRYYMKRAFEESRDKVRDIIVNEIQLVISKLGGD